MIKRLSLLALLILSNLTAAFAQEVHVKFKLSTQKVSDCEYDLKFNATIDDGWHLYSIKKAKGEDGPNPTSFSFNKSADYELVGPLKEGKTIKEHDKVFDMDVEYFKHSAVFTQRIKLKSDKAITIKGKSEYQACTEEQCIFPPADDFEFTVQGTAACKGGAATTTGTTTTEEVAAGTATAEVIPDSSQDVVQTVPATTEKIEQKVIEAEKKDDGTCRPWSKFLLGLLAGLGAVLMPCVYSLIPLTVSFFIKRSKSRVEGIKNSMLYGFFIIITFVIPTMLITVAFGPDALSNIATNTWLNIFFFVLFVIFALSFFGLFEITLPNSWGNKLDQKADKGGVLGIFFMAATLVVISFSCTAGFLGSLLAALAEGNSYLCPFAGFTGFGTGIALPFMIFAFFPSMLNSLPKSGGWMTTFKVTVAFIELALAVKFLANADNVNEWGFMTREVFIALWIAIFGMMTFYLMGMFKTSHEDLAPKPLSVGRILIATVSLAFTVYLIPGLWGAPLKLISSFPPPHHYSESPEGVGYHGGSTAQVSSTTDPVLAELEAKRVVGPNGLKLFKNDYESALKYAKLTHKPLFVDFTGNACVNCRLMESTVWVTPEVFPMLRDSMVIVSLYVDSKVELPKEEQKEVFWFGKQRTLETIGNKWAYFQSTKYGSSSQPQYVLLNHDESNATPGTMGTETDQTVFAHWLHSGLTGFRAKK